MVTIDYVKANIESKIPKIVFSEIKKTKHLFNEDNNQALQLSCLIPKNILTKSLELFYKDLGEYKKDKKIITSKIQSKGEVLSLKTSIVKKNNTTHIYVTDGENLSNEKSINNLLISLKKILQRKFLNDYIVEIEKRINKIDKKQNKIIRKNPDNLELNMGLFYKIYQKNESKKVGLIASLEELYKELDKVKNIYNSIR
tara:strand:+ start:105 stop:701 length:597 start_codon:yes stop_codon:yes gene_type:complete